MDSSGSGCGLMAGSCEQNKEQSGSIKDGEILILIDPAVIFSNTLLHTVSSKPCSLVYGLRRQ